MNLGKMRESQSEVGVALLITTPLFTSVSHLTRPLVVALPSLQRIIFQCCAF